jgi:hypothetical protein
VFKAGKVIITVSTSKIPKVKELLGNNTVDESKPSPTHPLAAQKHLLWLDKAKNKKERKLTGVQLSITPKKIPKQPLNQEQ